MGAEMNEREALKPNFGRRTLDDDRLSAEEHLILKQAQMENLFESFIKLWLFAAWITHIIVCLKTATWGFLIAGAILFPVALIHGTGIWFGWF